MLLHANSEDSDQTGWMPWLIWVFAGHTDHFVGFVSRQLIMLSGKCWAHQYSWQWVWLPIQGWWVWATARTHNFCAAWSWNNFYSHFRPSTDSRRAVVSYWRKYVLVLVWFLFYSPSTHFRSFRARSVTLTTLFLGKPPRQITST